METVTDIQLLSSWCPALGGDVCVSSLFFFSHHVITLNIITEYKSTAVCLFFTGFFIHIHHFLCPSVHIKYKINPLTPESTLNINIL